MQTLVQPYRMRSTVVEQGGALRISIPCARSWVKIAFLAIWLCGWTFGGFAVGGKVIRRFDLFDFAWMAFWAFASGSAVIELLRSLFGGDIVIADAQSLSIQKQIMGLGWTKTYSVADMRDLRFQPEVSAGRRGRTSRIAFDYGAKTIAFANQIDEAEADILLSRIRNHSKVADTSSPQQSGIKFWREERP